MENLLDKLKLLDYDTKFCQTEKMKPLSRHYFATAGNTSEQLYYFGKLMSWLLSLANQKFAAPDQYEDPNTIATNVMLELKKQGIPTDFSASKLKQGYGEEVCSVLNSCAQTALKATRWAWQKPAFAGDDYQEDTTVDEDLEVTTEKVAEEVIEDEVDDDDENFITAETVNRPTAKGETARNDELLEPTVDTSAWRLEVERVLPQLKIIIKPDAKDWRQHLETMQEHEKTMAESFTSTKGQLDKLQGEIARTLEKIESRDKYINTQLESIIHEYRTQQDTLTGHSNRYKQASTGVTDLTKELAKLTDELETIKQQTEERGASITDSAPVVKIKQSLTKIKAEISQMDLRIGVLQHTLLMSKVRAKSNIMEQMNADVETADPFS